MHITFIYNKLCNLLYKNLMVLHFVSRCSATNEMESHIKKSCKVIKQSFQCFIKCKQDRGNIFAKILLADFIFVKVCQKEVSRPEISKGK